MASADAIYVPVRDSEEEVKVDLNNLPDHNDVLDLLKAEQAPLDLWLAFAREYFKQGKVSEFLEFLQEGSSPEVEEFYADVKYDRIAILNALGAYYTSLGRTSKRQKDEYFIKAVDFYNKAARIDRRELTTWVGKGQLQVAKGELDQALEMFRIVLAEHKDHVPALLGEVPTAAAAAAAVPCHVAPSPAAQHFCTTNQACPKTLLLKPSQPSQELSSSCTRKPQVPATARQL
eukprot:jgi/Mesen1/6239/ME000321S05305